MNWTRFLRLWLPALLAAYSAVILAEIYKWQDESGKWHFSDTKPTNSAKNVEQKEVGPVNSTGNHNQALRKVFPAVPPAEELHGKETEAREQKRATERRYWCARARKRLKIMEGPVVFLDRDGQEIPTTEAEREVKARELRAQIDRLCP